MNENEIKFYREHFGDLEPCLDRLCIHGEDVLSVLWEFFAGEEDHLKARAIRVAAHMGTDAAMELVAAGAKDPNPSVRAAVAAGCGEHQNTQTIAIVRKLLGDQSPSVRRHAIKAAKNGNAADYFDELNEIQVSDSFDELRGFAGNIIST